MEEEQSFIDISLADTPELSALPEGEYRVQVTDAEMSTNKSGGKYVLLRLEVPNEPTSKDFTHYLGLPSDDDTEKQVIKRKNRIKETMEALGYDYAAQGGIDVDALVGLEGWAHLGESQDPEYGTQNSVRKWVKGQ